MTPKIQAPSSSAVDLESTDTTNGAPEVTRLTSDELIQALDWEPEHACEYTGKGPTPCGARATLFVVTAGMPCGCPGQARFFCDHCWHLRNDCARVYCRTHPEARVSPPSANILRVERLSR